MRSYSTLLALAAPLVVSALPFPRQDAANTQNLLVLNFAHVLEQLETQFYQQALQKFQSSDFTNAGFANANLATEQFTAIQSDEATHTSTLESVIGSLGGQVIQGCQFDFSSVLTDVPTMAAAARLVENVGVGAYLGAAHLLSDPTLLTAAASIVTVEARHQSILNVLSGTGSAIPQAFDMPLSPQQVLAIASPFISGCDTGITGNQPLTVSNGAGASAGTQLQLSAASVQNNDFTGLSCQLMVGGAAFSISQNLTSDGQGCIVPQNTNGPLAVYLTNSSQPLENNVVDQFLGNQVAGPAMLFIDASPEALGQLARNTGNSTVSSSTIVSPAEASSIASSGSSSSSNGTNVSSSSSSSSTPSSSSSSSNGTDVSSSSSSSSSNGTDGSSSSSSSNSTTPSATPVNVGNGTITSSSGSTTSSNGTVVGGNVAVGACGANAADTNNAIKPGGPNGYIGPTANCVFEIGATTNQPLLTASPFVNDTTVSGPGASITASGVSASLTSAASSASSTDGASASSSASVTDSASVSSSSSSA